MSESPRIGKYSVLGRIGSGGMAEVFKCLLSCRGGFDKVVALKRIRADLCSDPEFVQMFFEEARVAANLSHPNIVQTYEVDDLGSVPYIAMEYVRGPTFSQVIREQQKRGKASPTLAAKIVSGVCEALHHAHNAADVDGQQLGLIHRDVTPQNIIISLEGVPKLVDFGVARARGRAQLTHAGMVKGKLKFMAPEQFQSANDFDNRVDIFSAGVCLYQATTFHLPYSGETEQEVIRAATAGEFKRPSEWVPEYPPELEEIVLWAMSPNPEHRCPDAFQLHEALERYLSRQEKRCTSWTVRCYVQELFPDVDYSSGVRAKEATSSPNQPAPVQPPPLLRADAGTRKLPYSELEIDVLSQPNQARAPTAWLRWAALTVVAAFGAGYGIAFARDSEPVEPGAHKEAPPNAETLTAVSLLVEAELALNRGDRGAARALMERAKERLAQGGVAVDSKALPLEQRLQEAEARAQTPEPKPAAIPVEETVTWPEEPSKAVEASVAPAARREVKVEPAHLTVAPDRARPTQPRIRRELFASKERSELVASREALPILATSGRVRREETSVEQETPAIQPAALTSEPPSAEHAVSRVEEAPKHEVKAPPMALSAAPLQCPRAARSVQRALERWCELPSGTRHGGYERFFASGAKAEEGEYRSGKKHGRWVEYYEMGPERDRSMWRKGMRSW